jgi:transcriptional regulator with XRE-family HTH domain
VLLGKGLTLDLDEVAGRLGVDPKTVERWITVGRTPYPRHRHAIAAIVGESETYLWPDALPAQRRAEVARSEIVHVYPHRSEVPRDTWRHLFGQAEHEIGVLVYAGLFLAEDTSVQRMLHKKAASGVKVRILLGDPESQVVAERGNDEGVGDAMAAKIRNVLALYRPMRSVESVEFRFHQSVLYNSIYRADDELLVNAHIQGLTAAHAPVWHLRKLSGGEIADLYLDSFERVWAASRPTWVDQAE